MELNKAQYVKDEDNLRLAFEIGILEGTLGKINKYLSGELLESYYLQIENLNLEEQDY